MHEDIGRFEVVFRNIVADTLVEHGMLRAQPAVDRAVRVGTSLVLVKVPEDLPTITEDQAAGKALYGLSAAPPVSRQAARTDEPSHR